MIRMSIAAMPLAAMVLSPAYAQEAENATESTNAQIIVTGERQNRTVAETASSVDVTTAEALERRHLDTVEQLLASIPNVQIGSGDQAPTIRGQETTGVLAYADAFLGGSRPRTTVQVDGRALSYNEYVFGLSNLWDVAAVEVFRTPQTTTQGRNSIAGAIFVRTQEPSFSPEARLRALVGNYSTVQLSGVVSGPVITDQVAARIAVDWRDKKTFTIEPSAFPGSDPREDHYTNVRAKLLVKPATLPGLRLDLTYAHLASFGAQAERVTQPFARRRSSFPADGQFRINVDSLTGVLDYTLSPGVRLTVTPSHGWSVVDRLVPSGFGDARQQARDFSLETILAARLSDSLNLLAGVYHFDSHQREFFDLTAFLGTAGNFVDDQNSLGLFGEVTFKPVERFALTLGGRYQRDHQDRVGALGPLAVDYHRSFDAFLPKMSLSYELSDAATIGALALKAFNPGGTTISFNTGLEDSFEEETLWNYELFFRSKLLDDRLQLNANLFYTDFRDAQRVTTFITTGPLGQPVVESDIGNVPAARSYGAELELSFAASDTLSLNVGVGLLDTKVTRTPDPLDPILGRDFERAPKFSFSAGASWSPLPGLRLDSQLRRNGRYFSDDANTPGLRIAGSTSVDAKIAYNWRAFTVSAYARNVFDDFALTQLYAPDYGTANDPRTYGVSVEARF